MNYYNINPTDWKNSIVFDDSIKHLKTAEKLTFCDVLSLLLSVIVLSLTLKRDIVGGVLSVWTVVIERLSVEIFPAESDTVSVTLLFWELFIGGRENDFVKV